MCNLPRLGRRRGRAQSSTRTRRTQGRQDFVGKGLQLLGQLLRSLQRHVVYGVLEPVHAGLGLKLERSLYVGRLVGQRFGRIGRPSRWQKQHRAADLWQQLGWPVGP
jgi:hypothetical protein